MTAASCLGELAGGAAGVAEVQGGQDVERPLADVGVTQVLREDVEEHLIVGMHGKQRGLGGECPSDAETGNGTGVHACGGGSQSCRHSGMGVPEAVSARFQSRFCANEYVRQCWDSKAHMCCAGDPQHVMTTS